MLGTFASPLRQFTHVLKKSINPFSGHSAENHIGAQLAVTIPKLYPEVAPTIVVRSLKALTTVQRMTVQTMVDTMVWYFPLVSVSCLQGHAHSCLPPPWRPAYPLQIAEQVGMTMMYNISEAVKEWMQDRNVKQLSMHEQMTERQKLAEIKAEAQELKKAEAVEKVSEQIRHGTPVTPVVFAEWNLRFLAGVFAVVCPLGHVASFLSMYVVVVFSVSLGFLKPIHLLQYLTLFGVIVCMCTRAQRAQRAGRARGRGGRRPGQGQPPVGQAHLPRVSADGGARARRGRATGTTCAFCRLSTVVSHAGLLAVLVILFGFAPPPLLPCF